MQQNTTKLYDYKDFTFDVDFIGNPFLLPIRAKITKPDGSTFELNLFYNDEQSFVLRVYFDTVGLWKYKVYSDLKNAEIASGEIYCSEKTDLNGKLRKSATNNTHVCYADCTPFNMLGFEVDWLFLIDDKNSDFPKAKCLIDKIAENGFNMVIVSLFAKDVNWSTCVGGRNTQYDFSNPKQAPFIVKDNGEFDYSMLDVNFFKRVDKIIAYLNEKKIAIHLMVYVWNKLVKWAKLFSDEDNNFFKYVIDRYQAFPNLIWDISKEALSQASELYGYFVTNDDIRKKCEYVRQNDKFNTLLTVHDAGFCRNNSDMVDILSVQNWSYSLQPKMIEMIEKSGGNVVCNVEHGGYEKGVFEVFHGAYTSPEVCLMRNYISMFLGIYTVYYWQDSSWNIVIWDVDSLSEENRPKFHYYKNMRKYMDSMHYENILPLDITDKEALAIDNGYEYHRFKPIGLTHLTGMMQIDNKKGLNFKGKKAKWYNPIRDEYIETVIDFEDLFLGVKCPWSEEMAILCIQYK